MSAIQRKNFFKRAKTPVDAEKVTLASVDQSLRIPVVIFTLASLFWLSMGTVLALLASVKLTHPDFLGAYEWLTFGRVRSAHLNAMIYGWSNNAAFAVIIWLIARLSRVVLSINPLLYFAAFFWNLALVIGITGIMTGELTSVEWLEMPSKVAPLVFLSYGLFAIAALLIFSRRQVSHVYVSLWYLVAAVYWLPWLYSAAQILILFEPTKGVVQSLTNWWFAHNVLGLWLTPIALASAYYFIPKVLGKPIHSYYLSLMGFWSLALFYNWAGVHHLIGGPVPAWVVSAGVVASVMMLVPVTVVAINLHLTSLGSFKEISNSPTLRFIVFGSVNYTLVSLFGTSMAIRSVNEVTHFSHFTVGHAHHGVYAFFTMIMFGALYFIIPRVTNREWPSIFLIKVHFWSCAIGVLAMVFVLQVGGFIQGMQMNTPEIPFLDVVKNTMPWLKARTVSGVLMTVGHIAFVVHVIWLLARPTVRRGAASFSPQLNKKAHG